MDTIRTLARFTILALVLSAVFFGPISAEQLPEAERAFKRGVELYANNHYREAVVALEESLRLSPDNADALYHLGNSYREAGDLSSAIASYKKALDVRPNWGDGLYGLGVTYGMAGSAAEAINFLQKAIKAKPENPKAHYNLGVAYAQTGRLKEALSSFQEAARLDPKDPDYFLNLADTLDQLDQSKKAIDAFAKAILLKPEDPEPHYRIALLYVKTNQPGFATVHWLYLQKSNPALAEKLRQILFPKTTIAK